MACRHGGSSCRCELFYALRAAVVYDGVVRAGATLVGPTGAGKSTCYRILSRIMTSLHKAGSKNDQYQEVAFEILNPKCITMGELYTQR